MRGVPGIVAPGEPEARRWVGSLRVVWTSHLLFLGLYVACAPILRSRDVALVSGGPPEGAGPRAVAWSIGLIACALGAKRGLGRLGVPYGPALLCGWLGAEGIAVAGLALYVAGGTSGCFGAMWVSAVALLAFRFPTIDALARHEGGLSGRRSS